MKIWIYLDGRQQGPFELEELLDMPGVDENTKVWFEGLARWYPAGTLDEMRPLFDGSLAGAKAEEPQADDHSETPGEYMAAQEAEEQNQQVQRQEVIEEEAPRYAPGRIYVAGRPEGNCPPTYLGWSIFLTVCCCSPVSLAALIASICTSSFFMRGEAGKARKASEVAAWLIMISFALGLIPVMFMSMFLGN